VAGSRAPIRVVAVALALARWGFARRAPVAPRRIIVLHHLLLGDTLMLTALLAKLRERFAEAKIVLMLPSAFAPLYVGRPYGVVVHVFDPRDIATLWPLLRVPRFDLALLPADNRWSWLARAIGARWIVGFADDRPVHKNWPVDERVPYASLPAAFCDTAASLVSGAAPAPYRTSAWPAPPSQNAPALGGTYAVLHVGASSPLKLWEPARWRALAAWLKVRGLDVVWSAGPAEGAIIDAIDASQERRKFAGTLSLSALWHLLGGARLLVCPDTGIAHLGRIVGVPTVALFGPGSAVICGAGEFFASSAYRAVTVDPFPCRDQSIQFFRDVPWVRRCERLFGEPPTRCSRARCMEAINIDEVTAAIEALEVGINTSQRETRMGYKLPR